MVPSRSPSEAMACSMVPSSRQRQELLDERLERVEEVLGQDGVDRRDQQRPSAPTIVVSFAGRVAGGAAPSTQTAWPSAPETSTVCDLPGGLLRELAGVGDALAAFAIDDLAEAAVRIDRATGVELVATAAAAATTNTTNANLLISTHCIHSPSRGPFYRIVGRPTVSSRTNLTVL